MPKTVYNPIANNNGKISVTKEKFEGGLGKTSSNFNINNQFPNIQFKKIENI